jgi:hypothetical protein
MSADRHFAPPAVTDAQCSPPDTARVQRGNSPKRSAPRLPMPDVVGVRLERAQGVGEVLECHQDRVAILCQRLIVSSDSGAPTMQQGAALEGWLSDPRQQTKC